MFEHEYQKRLQDWKNGKRNPHAAGWVYVIGCEGHPYYKIGMAKNVAKRRASMQPGSPWKLVPIRKYYVGDRTLMERMFHKLFDHRRFYNEWFYLQEEDFCILDKMEEWITDEN